MTNPTTQYCSLSDLKLKFGEREVVSFSDKDGDGSEDTATVDASIDDMSSLIESYIGEVYDLPLASVPPVLRKICCDLVRYDLCGDAITKTMLLRYEAAIAFLKAIKDGSMTLGSEYSDSATSGIQYDSEDRVFTRTNLEVM